MSDDIFSAHRVLDPASAAGYSPKALRLKIGVGSDTAVSGMGLADVFGSDDRQLVEETDKPPWLMICSLVGWDANGPNHVGTGALVSPTLVLTAGHCLPRRRFDRIDVVPGRKGGKEPVGRRSVKPEQFCRHPDWQKFGLKDRDAGALKLDEPFSGIETFFEISAPPPGKLAKWQVNIAGYPGESPLGPVEDGDELWSESNVVKAVTDTEIRYRHDTVGGQSGSPVWVHAAEDRPATIVGIHAYGVPGNNPLLATDTNSATRIDADLAGHIRRWAVGNGGAGCGG